MTYAPQSISDARLFLLEYLDIHENTAAYRADLDPAEVGIVGDPAHWGGYHCGRDRVVPQDYSVVESMRDNRGLSGAAAALDVGDFSIMVAGKSHDLRSFSLWLVAQCKADMPDTADIREVIYSPDGQIVRRWDRLGARSDGDDSHLFHTHISYFRDSEARDKTALLRRYLAEIGVIEQPAAAEAAASLEEENSMTIIAHPNGSWFHLTSKGLIWLDAKERGAIQGTYTLVKADTETWGVYERAFPMLRPAKA